MSHEQTSSPITSILARFEDETHRPHCGVIFGVLALFTVVEIGWASTLPFSDFSLQAKQVDWVKLCQTVNAEDQADRQADGMRRMKKVLDADLANKGGGQVDKDGNGELSSAELAAASSYKILDRDGDGVVKKEEAIRPEELSPSGRPGQRILALIGQEARAIARKGAREALGDEEIEVLRKALNEKVIENLSFFSEGAFAAIAVNKSIENKVGDHRLQKAVQPVLSYLGEADVETLNRALIESAYPKTISALNRHLGMILGLLFFAILKALLVAEYFMHVKFEGIWVRILMLPTMAAVVILLTFLLPDVSRLHQTTWSEINLPIMAFAVISALVVSQILARRIDFTKMEAAHH